jgi:putative membrane protein
MSWVRTAAALIGFGFTIFQFGERLLPAAEGGGLGPRVLALAMIASGTIASFVALDEYRRVIRYMWSEPFAPLAGVDTRHPWRTPLGFIMILMALIGMFAFFAVLLRVG